jgi:serine/threonine-protein kinase HipA
MKRTIQVYLGNEAHHVGTLHYNLDGSRERSAFSYTESWLKTKSNFALEPALPLVVGPQFHRKTPHGSAFPLAIADTEPDGWSRRVIQRDFAKRRQNENRSEELKTPSQLTAVDYLLAADDLSRVGALRYKDENGVFCRTTEIGTRKAPPLIELDKLIRATKAIELNTETTKDLAFLRGRGTSLGGLRPKCSVIDSDGHLAIGKFPSIHDERPITKGEVLAMQLAKIAGINAAETRLIDSDGVPVTLIRRFDRTARGQRLMYISAATMLGVDNGDLNNHYYTQLVDLIRRYGSNTQKDIEELWRRIGFSILISNFDDHLHNHGFIHVNNEQWCLAPAFDINPFPDRIREFKTWISEKTGPEATISGLMSVIDYFCITNNRAKLILGEIERTVSKWRNIGKELGMSKKEMTMFEEAFEHPERDEVRKIMK